MALLEVVFGQKTRAKIGVVTLDASVNEMHKKSNEVTQHPVEEGVDVSDHVRRMPEELEIDGIITNTPVVFLATLFAGSPVDGDLSPTPDRAQRADQEFRRAMDAGELLTVITSLREYENMAITGYSVTRNAETGNILAFSASLREVVTVTTERVVAPVPVNPSSGGAANLGKKNSTEAGPDVSQKAQKRSVLKKISDAVGAAAGVQ